MQFTNLSALYLAFSALLIILLYLLKGQREDMIFSSVLLWDSIKHENINVRPRWKVLFNLLLFLQLLALTFFILAFMQPFLSTPGFEQDRVIIVMDKSASMQAVDVSPDRFSAARDRAVEYIDSLASDVEIAVIAGSNQPYLLVDLSRDHFLIKNRLENLSVTDAEIDIDETLSLASSFLQQDSDDRVVLFSDGLFQEPDSSYLEYLEFIQVGSPAPNAGIVNLNLQSKSGIRGDYQLYVEYANFSDETREIPYVIKSPETIFVDGRITLNPQEKKGQVYNLSARELTPVTVELLIDDYLALDNKAYTVIGSGKPLRILLAGEADPFLDRVLLSLAGVQVFAVENMPAGEQLQQFDLVIFNKINAPHDFQGKGLFIASFPPELSDLEYSQKEEPAGNLVWEKGNSLLDFINFQGLQVNKFYAFEPPDNVNQLVFTSQGPLISSGQDWIMLAFPLESSNFSLQTAFPLFIYNSLKWFYPDLFKTGYTQIETGEKYQFSTVGKSSVVEVITPEQQVLETENNIFLETQKKGIYSFMFDDDSRKYLAVNSFSEDDSNLLKTGFSFAQQEQLQEQQERKTGLKIIELWPLAVLIILIILFIEWYIYAKPDWGDDNAL